jgi:hypothetical protein
VHGKPLAVGTASVDQHEGFEGGDSKGWHEMYLEYAPVRVVQVDPDDKRPEDDNHTGNVYYSGSDGPTLGQCGHWCAYASERCERRWRVMCTFCWYLQ